MRQQVFYDRPFLSSFCLLLNAAPYPKFFTLISWWRNVFKVCHWLLIYKHRVEIPLKSHFELKRIYHYLLQDRKWQSVETKVLNLYNQEKICFISIDSEITWLQLLKRRIKASSCNLQEEHKGEGDFYIVEYFVLKSPKTCASTYFSGQKVY